MEESHSGDVQELQQYECTLTETGDVLGLCLHASTSDVLVYCRYNGADCVYMSRTNLGVQDCDCMYKLYVDAG